MAGLDIHANESLPDRDVAFDITDCDEITSNARPGGSKLLFLAWG